MRDVTPPMPRSIDRRTWAAWLAGFLVLALAGCSGLGRPGASTTPVPQPSSCGVIATAAPSRPPKGGCSGEAYTAAELRLLLIDELGPLWYCDRDEYPVGRDELDAMRATWPDLIADAALAGAVRERLELPSFDDPGWTDDERLQVYRLWKMATAVQLEPAGNDRFRFDYLAQPIADGAMGTRTAGMIDTHGAITVEQQAAAEEPICPICLSLGTRIDAPDGALAVERLRIGDAVWTLDRAGRRVAGTVIALGSTAAPANHHVLRVTLADGRSVTASPGHPLADGRALADLRRGDALDGSHVATIETLRYDAPETFDLVVSGQTGVCFAGGIPLGSTLD
jgi:Hint domain